MRDTSVVLAGRATASAGWPGCRVPSMPYVLRESSSRRRHSAPTMDVSSPMSSCGSKRSGASAGAGPCVDRSHELDDAAQDIFVLAWTRRHAFKGESAISTWLTRIAINYLSSKRRKHVRRLRIARQHARGPLWLTSGAVANQRDGTDRAMRCIARLPVKLRTAFVLRYQEEMSVEEIGHVLQIPEGTVRSRLYHARLKLRDMMKELDT